MVAKAKARPKDFNQMGDMASWNSQATGSGSEEELNLVPGFAWEALTRHPVTAAVNTAARKEYREVLPLQVPYRSPTCKGYCRPNQEMMLAPRQVSTSFFIYKADITFAHKCMLSTDFKKPHCAGTHAYLATRHT